MVEELEPLRTESFQMNYIKAADVQKLLVDPKQTLLSKRGSALLDDRSNMMFVKDTPSRLDDVREMIAKVDTPVRQVMIEARIVEAGDSFARAVTPFGQEYAFGLSVGLLAGGLVFSAPGTRDTGRDALEASILSFLIANVVLKPVIGRQRPQVSNGETVFDPFSHDPSFPSGHATEAFAVASVIAMRSDGWVVPTLAFTTASLVAVSRVEQSRHFTSDVFAGAVLGITVGRFVVSRHRPVPDGPPPAARVTLVAIPHGLAVHVSW